MADQIGEVIPGKVVKREITRVVTPGTNISDEQLFTHIVALSFA
ncbi:hypothetical protein KA013_01565 [Patescibacteria group bacterium]|nr:hypothetical protein [Patescibacteria group bacterium]